MSTKKVGSHSSSEKKQNKKKKTEKKKRYMIMSLYNFQKWLIS